MAKYIAVRPRWNPRGVVINYAMRGQLYVRSWPSRYRDANTAQQRRQRGKMAQVCGALPHLKDLLAEGYRPRYKRNGRKIGSYHVAVSVALQEWFADTPRGPQLDLSRLQLTEGIMQPPRGLTITRAGGALRVEWDAPLKWRRPRLLLAAREGGSNEWVSRPMPVEKGVTSAHITLPPAWAGKAIETWVAFADSCGRARTKTHYAKLAPAASGTGATGIVTGIVTGTAIGTTTANASAATAGCRAAQEGFPPD